MGSENWEADGSVVDVSQSEGAELGDGGGGRESALGENDRAISGHQQNEEVLGYDEMDEVRPGHE